MFRLLRSLFQRFEQQYVHDDFLGELTNDAHGNWHGKFHFAPIGHEIEISLRTGNAPPTESQIQFIRDVQKRFPSIWEQLRSNLFADLDDFADGTTMEQLFDGLRVDALAFWQLDGRPFAWEISCTTPLDDHIFGIEMVDFENNGFRMDG